MLAKITLTEITALVNQKFTAIFANNANNILSRIEFFNFRLRLEALFYISETATLTKKANILV